jgi:hypothetical protein
MIGDLMGDFVPAIPSNTGFWARIESEPLPGGGYGWVEVVPADYDRPGWRDGGHRATREEQPAWEVNGNMAVPIGTIVLMQCAPESMNLRFAHGAAPISMATIRTQPWILR